MNNSSTSCVRKPDTLAHIFEVLNFVFVALFLLQLLVVIAKIFIPYIWPEKDLLKLAGAKWAVVTEATSGIGVEYARQLAAKGFDVLLIGRVRAKLEEVGEEIRKAQPAVSVRPIVFDFSSATYENYEPLFKEIASIEVGLLVNNTDEHTNSPEIVTEKIEGKKGLVRVTTANTLPMLLMSTAVLEQMSVREKGIIINVSELSALVEMCYWSAYSSSKRYVLHLSNCLRQEYAPRGIIIQSVTRGETTDETGGKPSLFRPSPEKYVKSALRTVGIVNNTAGYCSHQLQDQWLSVAPMCLTNCIMRRKNEKIRRRNENMRAQPTSIEVGKT